MLVPCIMILVFIGQSRLIQVAEVFRHGARYPLEAAYDAEEQKTNWGELIPAGMRQHYNLGRLLRKEYIEDLKFLSSEFNHTELYVRSTDVNRTLVSVQSQLMGMYPDGPILPKGLMPDQLLPPNKGASDILNSSTTALPNAFQPIPIHIDPNNYDVLAPNCSGKNDLIMADYNNLQQLTAQFENETTAVRQAICDKFKSASCSVYDIFQLYDTYMSDLHQARTVPNFTQAELYAFRLISSFQFYAIFGPITSSYYSLPFFNNVFKYFGEKIADPSLSLKWITYSSHDVNLLVYAQILNISSVYCLYDLFMGNNSSPCKMQPEYAANIIFELHEEGSNKFLVRVRYNGEYQILCNQSTHCPFETFRELVMERLPSQEDYDETCQPISRFAWQEEQDNDIWRLHAVSFFAIIELAVIALLVVFILHTHQRHRNTLDHQRQINEIQLA